MRHTLRLGAIADDYTGGADLAGMLAQEGVRTVQLLGLPAEGFICSLSGKYQAAVVCLKSRSVPAEQACASSTEALRRLQLLEPMQFQFKYCSTFDSTSEGNIGPVTAALMGELQVGFTVAVPALPINQRTQYFGHLFVGSQLLSESPMRHHPINPMTDSNLVRHLQSQTDTKVGLIPLPVVRSGAEAILHEAGRLEAGGVRIALVDAIEDEDLRNIAEAVAGFRLITGGSGIGQKLAGVWKRRGQLAGSVVTSRQSLAGAEGVLILSGSCSAATLQQLDLLEKSGCPGVELDLHNLLKDQPGELDRLSSIAASRLRENPAFLVYSSASPRRRAQLLRKAEQSGFSSTQVPQQIESAFGQLARQILSRSNLRRIIVAGGETAGAVLHALGIPAVEVVDVLDPGVPALLALGEPEMGLVLKSGNFGSPDFFAKAVRYLEGL